MNQLNYLMIVFVCFFISGCAIKAPQYSFSPENIQHLKDASSAKVIVGEFHTTTPETETKDISMRGAQLISPYGNFSNYLREAIYQEFLVADRISSDAKIEIEGVLLKHKYSCNGFIEGEGELVARIFVRRDGLTTFDKNVTANTTWKSSFAGTVAIPKALAEYPRLAKTFVSNLLQDHDFINATK